MNRTLAAILFRDRAWWLKRARKYAHELVQTRPNAVQFGLSYCYEFIVVISAEKNEDISIEYFRFELNPRVSMTMHTQYMPVRASSLEEAMRISEHWVYNEIDRSMMAAEEPMIWCKV